MANKTLTTRIKLKFDSYKNWITDNPTLLAGELALTSVSVKQDGAVEHVPSILIKCGDGTHKYNELDYVYAKAADVLAACKSESALTAFVNNVIANAGIATDEALSTLAGRVATAEGDIDDLQTLVGSTAVATQITNAINALNLATTYEKKGEAAKVQTALNTYKTSNNAAVKTNSDAITAIKDGTTIDSFADVETALAGKQATGDYATKAEAQGYANAKDSAIAAAKKAGDDAQADVDALEAKVGTVADGKTVVEMISDAQTAATYDDTALKGRVTTVEGKVSTLIGTAKGDDTKSARTIAAEEVAKIVAGANTSYDTLKEIADWITGHKTDATAMNSAITTLEGKTSTLETNVDTNTTDIATLKGSGAGSVTKTVTDAIAALDSSVAATAATGNQYSVLTGVTETNGKLTAKQEVKLAAIAKTGNVNDIIQTAGDVLIFDCGTSVV